MYKYFISYSHGGGFGRCEITRDTLITGFEDIERIEKLIAKRNGFNSILILNYLLFNA